jgi:hypothetical protein
MLTVPVNLFDITGKNVILLSKRPTLLRKRILVSTRWKSVLDEIFIILDLLGLMIRW